jgi:cbb3-type cytochrome c oxidase subunit III
MRFLRAFLVVVIALITIGSNVSRASTQEPPSVWNGVFTQEHAERGRAAYAKNCSRCHGEDLAGRRDYPLSGERFIDHWEAHTLDHLFRLIRDSMPPDAINAVDAKDKRDIVAYLLQQNGFPAGSTDLSLDDDVLSTFEISRKNGPGPVKTGALVRVTGCLTPRGPLGDGWELASATEPEKTALPTGGAAQSAGSAVSGTRAIGLLNVFPSPAAHRGHTMIATGFLVKKGDSDAINVVALDMIAASCRP